MGRQKKLLTSDQAKPRKTQHKNPCSDCPFARAALAGWLGGLSPGQWLAKAHGEDKVDCHTTDKQCAGLAIYRANVCKSVRDPSYLRLPADRVRVFATPMEFQEHHRA